MEMRRCTPYPYYPYTASSSSSSESQLPPSRATNSAIEINTECVNENDQAGCYSDEDSGSSDSELNFREGERSIWSIAVQDGQSQQSQTELEKFASYYSTLFVLGNECVGKTTIVKQLLNTKDPTQPTVGIEFYYAKRKQFGHPTQVTHIYELGGSAAEAENADLLEVPIASCAYPDKLTIILVLDLSQPQTIWEMFETVLDICRRAAQKTVAQHGDDEADPTIERLETRMKSLTKRIPNTLIHNASEDPNRELFPIPVAIIGAKYEEFYPQSFRYKDPICRMLRVMAYKLGASICFYTAKDVALNRRVRDFLSFYAFDTLFPQTITLDSSLSLMLPHCFDTLPDIFPDLDPSTWSMKYIKTQFEVKMGIQYLQLPACEDPGLDPRYAEAEIDKKRDEAMRNIEDRARRRAELPAVDSDFVFQEYLDLHNIPRINSTVSVSSTNGRQH